MSGEIITNNDFMSNAHTLKNKLETFRHIRTFIFDVDGVMTDGKLQVTDEGAFLRTFHTRDGYAIRRAVEEGLNVCVITGGKGNSIEKRLKMLGVRHYYLGIDDKMPVLQNYFDAHNINPFEALYMGDDLNDFGVLQKVGLACCPFDACPEIIGISNYISPFKGGDGCVRDVIEKVMKLQGNWMRHLTISG